MGKYMTNDQLRTIQRGVDEIRQLVTLETASFSHDREKDARIKEDIKLWVQWFGVEATRIEDAVNGKIWKGGY